MRYLISADQIATTVFPPEITFHRPDGQQIESSEASFHANRGENIELRLNGERVGRIRPPNQSDRFSPKSLDVMGDMFETAKRENFDQAVNWLPPREKDRFWCPLCAKNQSHPAVFSMWVAPEPECKPVCYYGICKRCSNQGKTFSIHSNEAAFRRLVDLAEQRLVARYPHIAASLPAGYRDGSNDETQELQPVAGNLMIPNPVHPPKEGQLPEVVCRRYLVIRLLPLPELLDLESSLIWRLGEEYPLVMVCKDGEEPERLEAWFKVESWTEEACRAFMDLACSLGADPETFDPQCFVHLPGAINPATCKEQKVIYLDPEGQNFPDGPTPLRQKRPPQS